MNEPIRPEFPAPEARRCFECKICWHIYNPQLGDDFWQIAPGTAFNELPGNWRCPECDAAKNDFLAIPEDVDQV